VRDATGEGSVPATITFIPGGDRRAQQEAGQGRDGRPVQKRVRQADVKDHLLGLAVLVGSRKVGLGPVQHLTAA
jgi:hypothetical protein